MFLIVYVSNNIRIYYEQMSYNSTNCTNLTDCILVANDAFPYWTIIMSSILGMLFTFTIGIVVTYMSGYIVSFLSAMPTGIIFALLGVMLTSYGKESYDADISNFCHLFPIGLCMSSIMYMIWPLIYYRIQEKIKDNERLVRWLVFPLSCFLSCLFWLLSTGLIAIIVYFSNMTKISTIVLGLCFETITLYISILIFFIPIKIGKPTGKMDWTIIIKCIIVGIVVGACVVFDIFSIPVISGLLGAFPSVKIVVLIHVYYAHGYELFNNLAYLMALGNVSVGGFVLMSYYFSIISHPFVAILAGLTVCMLIFNVPLLTLYNKYGKRHE